MTATLVRWDGCYDAGWRDLIVPAAFSHPAKMARGLIARIFDHLFAIGALTKGATVLDPFGGIGTTAIEGASRGVRVICCELEPTFVALAHDNVAWHRPAWDAMGLPIPVIVRGDSRRLRQILQESVAAVVSSPPYAEIAAGAGGLNTKPAKPGQQGGRSAASASQDTDQRYGEAEGQLARLPVGTVAAVVSSPPFTQGYAGGGGINVKGYGPGGADKVGSRTYQGTGATREPGNLETLTLGAVDAVVSSPPDEASVSGKAHGIDWSTVDRAACGNRTRGADAKQAYGDTEGQLGREQGETFWTAAHQIVRETFAILQPGGVAVWVVKAFVRNKTLVDFPGDWRRLCEHVGFETLEEIHASLVSEETHAGLFGDRTRRRERKSFFRRLAEKKGSPRIDWETVWVMHKPSQARA